MSLDRPGRDLQPQGDDGRLVRLRVQLTTCRSRSVSSARLGPSSTHRRSWACRADSNSTVRMPPVIAGRTPPAATAVIAWHRPLKSSLPTMPCAPASRHRGRVLVQRESPVIARIGSVPFLERIRRHASVPGISSKLMSRSRMPARFSGSNARSMALMPRVGDPSDTNLRQLLADDRRESPQHDLVIIGNRQVISVVPHVH